MPRLFPRLGHPDGRMAVRVSGDRLDYVGLAMAVAAHARALERAGVKRGERVGVFAQPSASTVVALVGNACAGVVSVPLNPKIGTRELAHVLSDARPVALWAHDRAEAPETGGSTTWLPPIDLPRGGGSLLWPSGLAEADESDPLLVLYTSGTTGPPKGAVLTKRNVMSNIDALARAWLWREMDTVVHALPLFHVHGLVLGLFGSLRVGGALVWIPRFSEAAVASALSAEGTMLFAVPTMMRRLADAAESDASMRGALAGARVLISGSAALPIREHRRIERAVGKGVYERYGLTETLIDCAVRVTGPPRPGYVGPPLDGVELRIVAEDGADCPWDDQTLGEVWVRGPNVYAGYLNREPPSFPWFRTGDLATRAPDGAVRIVGRMSVDLIKTGGYKVGAGEVESCLLEQEGVKDAAVIGVADEDLGERIVAFIVPTDPSEPPELGGLIERVARELSPHKRPREVRLVEALPRNAMGKVQKATLSAMATGAEPT